MQTLTDNSLPYISGMGYRYICDLIYDEFHKDNIIKYQFNDCKIFVKTDYLHDFYTKIQPKLNCQYYLYTHNSDINIDGKYFDILNHKYLKIWYAQNVLLKHNKLKAIPIGLANKRWEHGNINILEEVINQNNEKNNLIYCNFDVKTNIIERTKCLEHTKIKLEDKKPFKQYLEDLSKNYFALCPNGNGIDCHKVWECFYLKTIPIVTKSEHFLQLSQEYPIYIIEKWEDFNINTFNIDLYNNIIK